MGPGFESLEVHQNKAGAPNRGSRLVLVHIVCDSEPRLFAAVRRKVQVRRPDQVEKTTPFFGARVLSPKRQRPLELSESRASINHVYLPQSTVFQKWQTERRLRPKAPPAILHQTKGEKTIFKKKRKTGALDRTGVPWYNAYVAGVRNRWRRTSLRFPASRDLMLFVCRGVAPAKRGVLYKENPRLRVLLCGKDPDGGRRSPPPFGVLLQSLLGDDQLAFVDAVVERLLGDGFAEQVSLQAVATDPV